MQEVIQKMLRVEDEARRTVEAAQQEARRGVAAAQEAARRETERALQAARDEARQLLDNARADALREKQRLLDQRRAAAQETLHIDGAAIREAADMVSQAVLGK